MPPPTRPLQLDFVITELEVGGAERSLARLACGLPRDEFACRVITLSGPPRGNPLLVDELRASGIPLQFLGGRGIRSAPSVWWRLRRLWRESPPDLVQAFLFHANLMAGLACPAGVPLAMGFRVADPRPWRIWLEKWVAGRQRIGVCVSNGVARCVSQRGFREHQLRVIPNGIEPSNYQGETPAQLASGGIPDHQPVLLVVGRLDPQKGLDWLCEMAPDLCAIDPYLHVAIAGDGPLHNWLAHRLAAMGLDKRIHLLGWRPDIPSLLKRSEILLLTSRYEGMPNVLLEAMAVGKPVVVTRVEGVDELLGPERDRQSVAFRDTAGFLERIRAILTRPELCKELSQNNLRRISEHFSLAAMIEHYAELYRSMRKQDGRSAG